MRIVGTVILSAALTLSTAVPALAQSGMQLDQTLMSAFRWRSIGPANMMGRVTDIEGIPSPSATFYFAASTGGIWKTMNNGTTYKPLFDVGRVISMGDLAIAPSDTLQIWAGTGEEDSRNSISPGHGIYKSTDGGETWTLMGLEQSGAIARIVVHPTNPDIVWVAALGQIWGPNPERGVYKTTDGGQTWRQVNFVSDRAGFSDVAIDPSNPNVLWAASWERARTPYSLQSGGPGSGLWKSTDGGENWTRVTGGGLPTTMLGRIGIAISISAPRYIYLMIEAEDDGGENMTGLWRSTNGGQTWEQRNTSNSRPFYYSQVRVDPQDPERVYFSSFNFSTDGGATVRGAAQGVHVDHHAQWIDPVNPNRFVTGNDGGIAITFDRGGNYIFPNTVPLGQFYNISYDMGIPYRVCGGLQDNYSWCGPSRKASGPITNHDWFSVSGGDGFVSQQDPRDPNIIYSESQGGNIGRLNLATGERVSVDEPSWQDVYRAYMDSIALIWPDTTVRPSGDVQRRVAELRQRASRDSAALQIRYNWNTPYILSPHNPDVLYIGSNRVLKSLNRGDDVFPISPDLSKGDTMKIRISTQTTGGITRDVTGAETYATVVSLAESPLARGLLYAGTDDGNVWMSPNDGATWESLNDRFAGVVPDTTYVSRIEPSHHVRDRVYITFDNHRRNDFTPYVFVSDDGGRSFRSIVSNLPTGSIDFVHVIREDPHNPNLLFVGTDVGLYASLNRGGSWQRFMEGLPTVPVHDIKIHPRDHELIAGTHGRSIWITDITALEQLTPAVVAAPSHLFVPKPAFHFGGPPTGGEFTAQLYFEAPTPGTGADIQYWLGSNAQNVEITVADRSGNTITTMNGPTERGLQSVSWNMRGSPPPPLPLSPSEHADSVMTERRLAVVVDSLVRAGTPRAQVDAAVASLRGAGDEPAFGGGGGRGGGRGGGGQSPPEFVERPAEGGAGGRGGGGRGGGGRAGGGGGGGEETLEQTIVRLVRGQQGGGGRGGRGGGRGGGGGGGGVLFPRRGGGGAPLADPGAYTITLTVDGRSMSQVLTVGRAPSAPEG